jgi:hypothetical protein
MLVVMALGGSVLLYLLWGVASHPIFWMMMAMIIYPVFQSGFIKSVIDGNAPNANSVEGAFFTAACGTCLLFMGLLPALIKNSLLRVTVLSALVLLGFLTLVYTERRDGVSFIRAVFDFWPPKGMIRGHIQVDQGYSV